jgi:phosphoglycolate phosphatase
MFATTPKAILFDWDNTLVDTWPLIHGGMRAVFEKRGLTPWTLDEVKDRCHESGREAFPKLFPDDWQSALDDFYEYVHDRHLEDLVMLPSATDLLKDLFACSVPIALVSNKTKPLLVKEVEYLGLCDIFSVVVGAGDAPRDKPDAAPLLLALDQLSVQPSMDVWMVGDTPADWAAARSAGVRAIGVGAMDMSLAGSAPDVMFFNLESVRCSLSC